MSFFRRWGVFIVFAAILALLVVPKLVLSGNSGNNAAAGQGGAQGSRTAPVRTEIVRAAPFNDRLLLNGSLVAEDGVMLRSETNGKVVQILFNEGSSVREGELLLKINDDELQAQRRNLLLDLELATLQEKRQQRLLESQSTTEEAYDESRIRRQKVEAEINRLDAAIAKTEIRAPFSGRIGLRQVSTGAYIDTSAVVATLQAVDRLKVDFSIPERYLADVRTGLEVSVNVSGFSQTFTGKIFAIEPRIDAGTRTILCRARIDNKDGLLLPGGFATIEMTLNAIQDAILIPSVAIIPDLEQTTLFVVENGKAVERIVSTGLRTENQIQILSGLQAGEQVVVAGTQSLRNGTEVEIIEAQ